jgi:outer membrane protein TolC
MKIKIQYISIYFYIFLLISLSLNLRAQDSLGKYLEIAAGNNPEIKAAFNRYQAALEKVPQAGSLPDPQASLGYFIKPMQLLGGNQVADIQLMQMFPWFGTLKAGKDEASMMAKAKYEEFNSSKAELFYRVKSSWYQLMKYDREIALVNENLEMLKSIEKVAIVKFQSPVSDVPSQPMPGSGSITNTSEGTMNSTGSGMGGTNNQQGTRNNMGTNNTSSAMSSGMNTTQSGLEDVLRVKMEILEQENKLASLSDQRRTEEATFNGMLNRSLEINIQISDSLVVQPLPAERLAITDSIMNNNSMLSMLQNETGTYLLMEQKAKKMGLPMLGIGLDYMLIKERSGNTSMMNGKDMIMPMVSVSIPIYRKKYNAMQNEARFMKEAGNQQIIDLKNSLMVQYRQIIQRLDDAERRIVLYTEQEDLARRTTGLLLSGFATTGSSYEEVLRMQLKALDYGFKSIEAIVDYNTSVAMVEMLINSIKY